VGAAIASAVEDALQCTGLVRQLPLTPQRVKAMLKELQSRRELPA
jgi:CO/xanthine dehydrogenase Mo-binding subunit